MKKIVIITNNNSQMMVLETVLFAVMVLTAVFFVYQLSPSSSVDADISSAELKTIGDDALRTSDKTPPNVPGAYYNSLLTKYVELNENEKLADFLSQLLPEYVGFNIYLSDGVNKYLFYDGEKLVGEKVGLVTVSHRTIVKPTKLDISGLPSLPGSSEKNFYLVDVILEMWYI